MHIYFTNIIKSGIFVANLFNHFVICKQQNLILISACKICDKYILLWLIEKKNNFDIFVPEFKGE